MASIPTTFLVAPDSFKGTFSAVVVAEAIRRGLEDAGRPVNLCPLADGGEGTLEVLLEPLAAVRRTAEVSDPLGRRVEASFALAGSTAIVEMAAASGLDRVAEADRDPVAATTYGTGELIVAAVQQGAQAVLLAVGGSATTDGGAGAIEAIEAAGGMGGARLTVLCDVRTPYEAAAEVFAPQKGADPATVAELSERLAHLASVLPRDPRGVPMTGAAGGLSGGLWATFGAALVAGAPFVLDAVDFDRRMRGARAVITGEGRLDRQSLVGKVVCEVSTRARQSGVPCAAVVAVSDLDPFDQRILDLQAVIEAGTEAELEAAGRQLAELI